ncbi:MAG: hypothetical protein ACTHMG_11605 [Sphingomonas sp.]
MAELDWRWAIVGALLIVAIGAGIADWRRRRRADLDRIGIVHWPSVQMIALIAAVAVGMALTHG